MSTASEMSTSDPVSIRSGEASVVAQSMKMQDKGRVIILKDKVRMTINPSAIKSTDRSDQLTWRRTAFFHIGLGGLLRSFSAAGPACAGPWALRTTESRMTGLALSGDEPIQIESDLLKINEETSQATFTGNVKVVQGDTVLQAGEMIVHYTNDGGSVSSGTADIREIELFKKVLIRSGTQTATADAGNFNMANEVLVAHGREGCPDRRRECVHRLQADRRDEERPGQARQLRPPGYDPA
jgi:lipopolysaccharide export system protein LptA